MNEFLIYLKQTRAVQSILHCEGEGTFHRGLILLVRRIMWVLLIPTKRRIRTAATVLVLVHLLAILPYTRFRTRVIVYPPGSKYEVRGCRCPDFVSWESYAERCEHLPDSELTVDCRKMTNDL